MAPLELFPIPSLASSVWPGVTVESTRALREVLKDNHERWHVLFNDQGKFHNHITHHVLAIWAMGAPASVIRAVYEKDSIYQEPVPSPPEGITEQNFNTHLGDRDFYLGYVSFFQDVIERKGVDYALEEYIFSAQANVGEGGGEGNPEMLNRFLAALMHPMIHTGYGFEFDVVGMVVEGLAQTAIHQTPATPIIPLSLFKQADSNISLVRRMRNVLSFASSAPPHNAVHAFTILARMLKDDRLAGTRDRCQLTMFESVVNEHGGTILKYAEQWAPESTFDPKAKVEEIMWAVTMLYAIPGWTEGQEFNADFFLMHLVTSAYFLPPLLTRLALHSQWLLLRSFFAVALAWWIARGRPALDIAPFFATDLPPQLPALTHKPQWHLTYSPITPANPWLQIIENAITHPDDHVPKVQRALAKFATLYGAAGVQAEVELEGAEKLDGTLFLRSAVLTFERVNKEPKLIEGDVVSELAFAWDRKGFYESGE